MVTGGDTTGVAVGVACALPRKHRSVTDATTAASATARRRADAPIPPEPDATLVIIATLLAAPDRSSRSRPIDTRRRDLAAGHSQASASRRVARPAPVLGIAVCICR
jgi:hypothetical protein